MTARVSGGSGFRTWGRRQTKWGVVGLKLCVYRGMPFPPQEVFNPTVAVLQRLTSPPELAGDVQPAVRHKWEGIHQVQFRKADMERKYLERLEGECRVVGVAEACCDACATRGRPLQAHAGRT